MKIKSTRKFIEKSQKDQLTTTDIYKFIESHTNFDLQKLLLLKNDIIEYKKRTVLDNVEDIQSSPKFIAMELNGEKIPLYSNFTQILEETNDVNEHEKIFEAEMDDFIAEFMPGHFTGINRAQKVLQMKIEYVIQELLDEDEESIENSSREKINKSPLTWIGSDLEFTEIIKALIEAKLIKGKTEEEIFQVLGKAVNIPEFDKTQKLRAIKKRNKDISPTLESMEYYLEKWTLRKGR